MAKPGDHRDTAACEHISRMLARISDKWTLLVVRTLGNGPRRFNALRREFLTPVQTLAEWVVANSSRIDAARIAYAKSRARE